MSVIDLTGELVPGSLLELALRILLALLSGAVVGVERQWHHKSAGIRTHALLALGATGFALISHLLFLRSNPQINATQIAAGVVTGIGFICGGVIMHRGGSVQGLNTAASLWTTAGIGLAIGAGYYPLACVMLVAVLIVQFPFVWIEDWLDQRGASSLAGSIWQVRIRGSRVAVDDIWAYCTGGAVTRADVRQLSMQACGDDVILRAEVSLSEAEALTLVRLAKESRDGIVAVRCTRTAGDLDHGAGWRRGR
jgi:putative Mg2+ transporter-C (MgtC) family protein